MLYLSTTCQLSLCAATTHSNQISNLRDHHNSYDHHPENHHQQGSENGDQWVPELNQNTICLHPAVQSTSVSLQAPFPHIAKSPSISSLRPGRTFLSRRHVKAKVFSACEEDLPPLNDGDDEEADTERDQLIKIKLPNTFVSSFRLEKFSACPKSKLRNVHCRTKPRLAPRRLKQRAYSDRLLPLATPLILLPRRISPLPGLGLLLLLPHPVFSPRPPALVSCLVPRIIIPPSQQILLYRLPS